MANDENPFAKFKFGTQPTPEPVAPSAPVNPDDPFAGRKFVKEYPKYTGAEGEVGPPMPPAPEVTASGTGKATAAGAMEGIASIPGQFGEYTSGIFTTPAAMAEGAINMTEAARKYMTGKEKPESETYIKGVEAAKEWIDKMNRYGAMARYASLPSAVSIAQGGPSLLAPTTKEISHMVQPYAEEYLGVGPEYEPQNKAEKVAKSVGSFGASSLAGPGKVIPRVVSGLAAGAGSELAGQQAEGTAFETPARIAGALVGGVTPDVLKTTGKFAFSPESLAKEKLGQVISDYNVESARPTQIFGGLPGITGAFESIPDRMRAFGRRLTGIDQDLPAFQKMIDEQGAAQRDRVYGIARKNPNAASIPTEVFGDLADRPIFKRAQALADEAAANNPEWGLVKPSEGGQGNLAYWDEVKRQLDRMYTTEDPKTVHNIKKLLTGKLDEHVPEYRSARDIASDTFNASSAPEAGLKFMSNIDSFDRAEIADAIRGYNPQQRTAFNAGVMQNIYDAIDKGQIGSIAKKMMGDRIFQDKLQTALGNEQFSVLRGKVLSENMIDSAYKNYAREARKAATDVMSPAKAGLTTAVGATALFDVQLVQNMLEQMHIKPTTTALLIGGYATGALSKYAANAAERRVVKSMFDLIQREDPRAFRELDELTRKYPDIYRGILGPLAAKAAGEGGEEEEGQATPTVPAQPQQTAPAPRVMGPSSQTQAPAQPAQPAPRIFRKEAAGGRVGRATGGRASKVMTAESLMSAAKAAKLKINKTTEQILNQPDEAVVKALDIANRHI